MYVFVIDVVAVNIASWTFLSLLLSGSTVENVIGKEERGQNVESNYLKTFTLNYKSTRDT